MLQCHRPSIRDGRPKLLTRLRRIRDELKLTWPARVERWRDHGGLPVHDCGADGAIEEGVAWLSRAQDFSASADGGVSRHYSLISGWATSYPETTGYIIPTMITYANLRGVDEAKKRAKRMLDWLAGIQYSNGGFQGGLINADPIVPVTFNTGQILLGLVAGVVAFGEHTEAMCRAANWLVETQDPDGCWRQYPTPFALSGEKTYETHVAWALLEAARLYPAAPYADAGLLNVRWALRQQRDNGWLANCCLTDPERPLTHTLGYALRGIIEAFRYSNDEMYLMAARSTADGLLSSLQPGGRLPGRLFQTWTAAADWVCLTGAAQVAHCWLMLYGYTGDVRYRDAGLAANAYVRRTIRVQGHPAIRGAVKGSFPIDGSYGSYEYLNWAVKFFVDSNILEKSICSA